jgi:MFS family permease
MPLDAVQATSRRRRALALLAAAQFMVVLDAVIVNVALPSIQRDLGFSEANLQWVFNAYTLAFGDLLLLGGRIADLLGRRRLFAVGVALLTVRRRDTRRWTCGTPFATTRLEPELTKPAGRA